MMEFDDLHDELAAILDSALKYAYSLNRDASFEIYLHYQTDSSVEIDNGVVNSSDGVIAGNAVRVVTGSKEDKKINFTSSSGIDLEKVKLNVKEALKINKVIKVKDPQFVSFPDPVPIGKEGMISNEIITTETADLVPTTLDLIEESKIDDRIKTISAGQEISHGGYAVGNSNGLLSIARGVAASAYVYTQAVDGDERKEAYESEISRKKLPDMTGKGEKSAKKALSMLGGKKFNESLKLPTIWDNNASASFIRAGIGAGINARPVVEGRSPLRDKIGEKVASNLFSLIDDGQNPEFLFTFACDAEGLPQKINPIVENGVFKSFIFNDYYAKIFGTKSTGNCVRRGTLPYESTPSIAGTTYVVKEGTKSQEELLSEIDGRALLIHNAPMGIFHSNVATGEFSAVANSVFLIEKGEIVTPVFSASVSGNFYEGLKNILRIGRNTELTTLGVKTPWLVIDGFSLVF